MAYDYGTTDGYCVRWYRYAFSFIKENEVHLTIHGISYNLEDLWDIQIYLRSSETSL